MTCKPCAERRKKWLAKKQEKREKGNKIQAAAIGAALAVIDAVAGEATDGQGNSRVEHEDQRSG